MTMLSFRTDDKDARDVQLWADRLGVARSKLLREALHRHLVHLRAEDDITAWLRRPPTDDETSLAEIAEWGPAEDWSEWADATG